MRLPEDRPEGRAGLEPRDAFFIIVVLSGAALIVYTWLEELRAL